MTPRSGNLPPHPRDPSERGRRTAAGDGRTEALGAARLCGLAAEAVAEELWEHGVNLYTRAMATGDPEWAPFAAVVLGNLMAESGRYQEAEKALRVAVASDHPIWAFSAAHHLASLATRLRDPAVPAATEESAEDCAPPGWDAMTDRPIGAEPVRRRRSAVAAATALAAVLCASAAGVAVGLHDDEVADRTAVRERSVVVAGEVSGVDAAFYEIRYSRQGRPSQLRVPRQWPDGEDRGFTLGAAVPLLDDPLDGTDVPFVAADLDHPEPWFEPGAIVGLLVLAVVLGAAAVVEGRRWRPPGPCGQQRRPWSNPSIHISGGHAGPTGLTTSHYCSRPSPHPFGRRRGLSP